MEYHHSTATHLSIEHIPAHPDKYFGALGSSGWVECYQNLNSRDKSIILADWIASHFQ